METETIEISRPEVDSWFFVDVVMWGNKFAPFSRIELIEYERRLLKQGWVPDKKPVHKWGRSITTWRKA